MRCGILLICVIALVAQGRSFAQEEAEASQRMLEAMKSAAFPVPTGEPEELAAFVKELGELKTDLSNEYRSLTGRITEAQTVAAERILQQRETVSDEAYYEAAKYVIPTKISTLARSTPEQQQEIVELVARQLNIGLEQGLSSADVNMAFQLVSYLDRYGDPILAKEAATNIAAVLKKANDPKYAAPLSAIEGIAKRLSVMGSEINLEGKLIDGTNFDWSSYRGKVVLVDFWATWCGPCVAEMPNVKQNYEIYHDRGFEVVGISLDSDRDALNSFLEKNRIPWVSLFEDGAGWKHPVAVQYGVRSIPSAWLVDRTGKVVSMKARGLSLNEELTRLLGPPTGAARDFAVKGQWDQASQAMREFVKNHSHMKFFKGLAAAQLKQGDDDGYGETCSQVWGTRQELDIWQQGGVVVVCSLSPNGGIDAKQVADFANQIDENSTHPYMRLFKCMAAYRAGRYEECSPFVRKGEEFTECMTKFFCAMASHQLGKEAEAKQLFSEASTLTEQKFSDLSKTRENPNKKDHWIDCVMLDLLQSEAEAALKTDASEVSVSSR